MKLFQHHAAAMTKATIASQVAVSRPAHCCAVLCSLDPLGHACLALAPAPVLPPALPRKGFLRPPLPLQIPAAAAAVFLLNGQGVAALAFGGLALLAAWVFALWRDQISLATRLLGISAHGLAANSGIITATVLLNLAALVAVLPLGAFLGALGLGELGRAIWGGEGRRAGCMPPSHNPAATSHHLSAPPSLLFPWCRVCCDERPAHP